MLDRSSHTRPDPLEGLTVGDELKEKQWGKGSWELKRRLRKGERREQIPLESLFLGVPLDRLFDLQQSS